MLRLFRLKEILLYKIKLLTVTKRIFSFRLLNISSCKIVLAIILCANLNKAKAQDIHFSQFYEAPLLRNPSLAGIFTGDIRAQIVYRDQWNSFTNAYRSGSFNAEYKMPVGRGDDFITAGLQMLYDKAGTVSLTSSHLMPAINYHKALSSNRNMYLSADGSVGASINSSFGEEQKNNLFFGIAYHHLNRPSNSFYRSADAALHP